MTFILGKIGWAIVQPGNLLMLLLLLGIFLGTRRHDRAARFLILLSALGFLVIAVAPVGQGLLLPLEQRFASASALPAKIDGIVLLGGATNPQPSRAAEANASNGSFRRILAAVALARRYPEAKLVLLGGQTTLLPVGYAESRAIVGFIASQGIDRTRVVVEQRSRTTYEDAVLGRQLEEPKAGQVWVLVTSAYHMPRAVASFRAVGWPVIPYPVDYRVDPQHWLRPHFSLVDGLNETTIATKEWLGMAFYRAMGWTKQWFPRPQPAAAHAAKP